ncbi:unnamed protein product, partial [Choristocarpus tenellus]
MYTPLIGDEKRDVVEYTSLGFMNCAHTMLTYTRAMDSALCVPLMIDAAVWCDYFARVGTPLEQVARALAYLFKVPEGGARGVDPGFFRQMRALEETLEGTLVGEGGGLAQKAGEVPGGSDVAALITGRVVCAGISCLDLQLCASTLEGGVETIQSFEETKYCPGGSCPQTSTVLAEMGVPGVVAITKMGADAHGNEMIKQMSAAGVDCNRVIRDPSTQTALAVLPIYTSGARGCFVNLAANNDLTPEEVLVALGDISADDSSPIVVVHYGYPHFTPKIQGQTLSDVLHQAGRLPGSPLVSMDLNGVDPSKGAEWHEKVIGSALPRVDLLHANLEEAEAIVGSTGEGVSEDQHVQSLAEWFLSHGVAMVSITMGGRGSFTAVTADNDRLDSSLSLRRQVAVWAGGAIRLAAFAPGKDSPINTNGAGDSFAGSLALAAGAWKDPLTLKEAVTFAALSALQRVDGRLRDAEAKKSVADLMAVVRS